LHDIFPITEKVAKKGLWLPSSTFLSDYDIKKICKKIRIFYEKN